MTGLSRRQLLIIGGSLLTVANAAASVCQDVGGPRDLCLSELARRLLLGLRSSLVADFMSDWPRHAPQRSVTPQVEPVLRWLPSAAVRAPAFAMAFASSLWRASSMLAWRRSYQLPAVTEDFLDNYAWCELVGLSGELPSQHLACGCLLLGPDTVYPRHRHQADEIYVPLSGRAAWGRGDGNWQPLEPGTIIHHPSDEPHAMRTEAQPLLALYLWRSSSLNQKSRLDP